MAKVTVTIEGKEYPIKNTMGAMLRFTQETGKEVNEVSTSSSLSAVYAWCCIKSACDHDKVDFDMSLMEFADSISVNEVTDILLALSASDEKASPKTEKEKSEKNVK